MTNAISQEKYQRYIAYWLLLCALVIFSMIVLGGITRLTRSGLSIVEWQPLMGVIPPLNEADWQTAFKKYQAYPEYQKVNRDMMLTDFKFIFYFEYAHRLLGRLIGVLFLIPFLYFYVRQHIPKKITPQLLGVFVLGGLQGLLGWYMVKSGLVDEPRVSQYRLTAHLGMAVIIYAYILWIAFKLLFKCSPTDSVSKIYRYAQAFSVLIFVMILSGGLVAGTRAGLIYNSFPLMGNYFIPEGLFSMHPWWLNPFENLVAIQFNHRMLAYLIVVTGLCLSVYVLHHVQQSSVRLAVCLLSLALILQIVLGIMTLLYQVPVALGASHQGGAILLLSASLLLTYRLKKDQ